MRLPFSSVPSVTTPTQFPSLHLLIQLSLLPLRVNCFAIRPTPQTVYLSHHECQNTFHLTVADFAHREHLAVHERAQIVPSQSSKFDEIFAVEKTLAVFSGKPRDIVGDKKGRGSKLFRFPYCNFYKTFYSLCKLVRLANFWLIFSCQCSK